MTDAFAAGFVAVAFGQTLLLLLTARTALAERWRRIEAERERDMLADVIRRRVKADEGVLTWVDPSRN